MSKQLTTSSASALERLRLIMLVPALLGAALVIPDIAFGPRPAVLRVAGIACALALCAYWTWGYRRRGFAALGLVPESAALAVALLAASGVPPLPMFALAFRGLYARSLRAALRYVAWLGILWLVALAHGHANPSDLIGKTAGLTILAVMMFLLVRTFGRLDGTESRLRAIIEQSTDIVTVVDAQLRILWRGTGVGDDAPRLLEGTSFLDLIDPADASTVERLLACAEAGASDLHPTVVRMHDREVELVIGNRLDDEHIRGFLLTIRDVTERRRLERERHALEAERASDEAARHELDRLRERVEAQRERQQLEAKLQRSQRLEAVGHLAGGVAHDFNNLLAAILNYTTIVREDLPEDHLAQDDLHEVEAAARRGARLVKQLLVFSKGQPTRPTTLDPNAVVENLDGLLRGSLPSHVRLEYDLDPAPAAIAADVTNVEQVVVNLVVNARDALEPEGGTITVSTGAVELTPDEAVDRDVAPGSYVSLSIADDGCGMDEATRKRALEPFFSTKPPSTGTGLGLATVAGIASDAGGWVAIDSEPGAGTTVRVNLPAVSEVESVELV